MDPRTAASSQGGGSSCRHSCGADTESLSVQDTEVGGKTTVRLTLVAASKAEGRNGPNNSKDIL